MENRTITVVSTRDQKRTTVETNATTLAELKVALDAANVDYAGMTFFEGISHTELLSDESVLPHDVPYKGETTNNLVFMLTQPNKKVRSGSLSEARLALYDAIMEGNYADAVREKFGRNFTNCSNADLSAFLEEVNTPSVSGVDAGVRNALEILVDILYEEDYLTDREVSRVKAAFTTPSTPSNSPYSDSELDEIVDTMSEFIQ